MPHRLLIRARKSSLKQLSIHDDDDDYDREDSLKSVTEPKNVQFSTIEVRNYSLCLGDHPCVNRGAPVSLDWEYQAEQSYDLEEYEQKSSGKKRSRQQLILQAFEREYILRILGYSTEEIKIRSTSVKKDKKKRSQTRKTMIFEPFMIISEQTRRWISKRKGLHQSQTNNNKPIMFSSLDTVASASTASETEDIMVCDQ